jgi:preprotein translocase subunit SecG
MITLLTIIHIIISVFLILVVLLQQGKGQDFAGTFGGGGTQASFGARSSATLLHRLTTVAAVMFMVTSLSLTVLISQPGTGSVISDDIGPVNVEPIDVAPVADEAGPLVADDAPPVLGETPEPEVETEN